MKRTDISRLRRNRALHFQIGLITALSFSLVCLNWTSFEESPNSRPILELDPLVEIEIVPNTLQKKKTPPPPPPPEKMDLTKVEIVDEDIEAPTFLDDIEIEKMEVDKNVIVKKKEVKQEIPTPPPPPPIKREEEKPYLRVERMPKFGDCSEFKTETERNECSGKNLLEYVYSKIKYPSMARENQVEGMVVVSFVVDKNGKVKDLVMRRDIGAGCGNEVLRVLEDLPDWKPGSQQGRKVAVMYNLPVKFSLQ